MKLFPRERGKAVPVVNVGRICCRRVDFADPGESVRAAAQRMTAKDVGTLLVVDGARRPLGILSERDVVVRVLALGRDPELVTVGEAMTYGPVTVREDSPVERAFERMRAHGVRRLPVVAADGRLVGVLGVDDVLDLLVEEFEAWDASPAVRVAEPAAAS